MLLDSFAVLQRFPRVREFERRMLFLWLWDMRWIRMFGTSRRYDELLVSDLVYP